MEYNNEIIKNISFDFKNREKVRLSCTEGLKYRISHKPNSSSQFKRMLTQIAAFLSVIACGNFPIPVIRKSTHVSFLVFKL